MNIHQIEQKNRIKSTYQIKEDYKIVQKVCWMNNFIDIWLNME